MITGHVFSSAPPGGVILTAQYCSVTAISIIGAVSKCPVVDVPA